MKGQMSIGRLEFLRTATLKRLAKVGPFLSGSLSQIKRKCGNPTCHCAQGEKHSAYLLTWKAKQKTRALYIPVDLIQEVKNWIEEYRKIQRLIQKMTEYNHQIIQRHVPTRRAKEKNRRLRQKIWGIF